MYSIFGIMLAFSLGVTIIGIILVIIKEAYMAKKAKYYPYNSKKDVCRVCYTPGKTYEIRIKRENPYKKKWA